jgi:hypothetical protein
MGVLASPEEPSVIPARDWRQYTIRVLSGRDSAGYVGMGLMVDPRHFVTCAHVVNVALHGESRISTRHEPRQGARVHIQFPELSAPRPAEVHRCRIVHWIAPTEHAADFIGDLVGLELDDDSRLPAGVGAAPLLHYGTLPKPAENTGYTVEAFGYPASRSAGSFIRGRFSRVLGNGLLQLEALSLQRPQVGYSGAPILSRGGARTEPVDYVLGILNYSSRDGSAADAYGVCAAKLASLWPLLYPALVASTLMCRGIGSVKGFQIGPNFTFDGRRIIAERHTLMRGEEAFALWTPRPFVTSFVPIGESVVFTKNGIRVHPNKLFRAADKRHIFVPYEKIASYNFEEGTVLVIADQASHDKTVIKVSGSGQTISLTYSAQVLSVLKEIRDVLTLSLY